MGKEIKVSNGKWIAIVDDEDFDYLTQWKWHFITHGYAARIISKDGKKKHILMHRDILEHRGIVVPHKMEVDHINRNGLDNRFCNLRICDRSHNMANTNSHSDATSGKKGVHWNKLCNKWRAQIAPNGKRISLGLFDNIDDAARAYNDAAKKYFGDFSRGNEV